MLEKKDLSEDRRRDLRDRTRRLERDIGPLEGLLMVQESLAVMTGQ